MTQASQSAHPDSPSVGTAVHRFEHHVRETPQAIALIHGSERVTYGQLDARAERLAHDLRARGLPARARVAIGTARQQDLVVALLAVLKAGAAHVLVDALDARTGRRQLAALSAQAARPHLLLTDGPGRARLDEGHGLPVLRLDTPDDRADVPPQDVPPQDAPPQGRVPGARTAGAGAAEDPPAAVLLTGAADPRPVVVGHRALLAALDGWIEVARLTPEDRHLFTGPPDATAFATGWTRALCTGGALVLPEAALWNPGDLADTVRREGVTVVYADPGSAVRLTARADGAPSATGPRTPDDRLRSLRLLAVGGDRLHLDEQTALQDRLRTGARVLNVYAPTECAGAGTFFELSQHPRPSEDTGHLSLLGTPFPGCRVHVRDGEIHLAPPGGANALPTGDLGRIRPDGLLEFGGRLRDRITLDDGSRLDPYTVESAIRSHPGFGGAVVLPLPLPAGARTTLVAYVTPTPDNPGWARLGPSQDLDGLRDHLAGRVPRAATPQRLVRLRTLPRDRTGREDRQGAPRPPTALPATGSKYGGRARSKTGPMAWGWGIGILLIPLVPIVMLATFFLWPGSTDLTGVPAPWRHLFLLLYFFESLAFLYGLAFLLWGKKSLKARGRGKGMTTAAHLALSYLLIAWWPQDNLYRLAAKTDWSRQAALVYTFNVPLMIAAILVIRFVTWSPAPDRARKGADAVEAADAAD
ncbi:AMP-binding protein [Streptomyces sp. RerS4]|uniref:AMP-binding protein n=1 Tax=Streptomyces sp. RerS4 TaxID=2942449 RepID=UPI0032E366D7